jgi:hypothetical protein
MRWSGEHWVTRTRSGISTKVKQLINDGFCDKDKLMLFPNLYHNIKEQIAL